MSNTGKWGDKIIITLHGDGIRRHKTWCKHYIRDDKWCAKHDFRCPGAAHCDDYIAHQREQPLKLNKDEVYTVLEIPENEKDPALSYISGSAAKIPPLLACVNGKHPALDEKITGCTVLVRRPKDKVVIGTVTRKYKVYEESNREYVPRLDVECDDGTVLKLDRRMITSNKLLWVLEEINDK